MENNSMLRGDISDPRLLDSITKSVENFKKAIALFDSPVVPLEIPYEGHTLPGYLFLPKPGTECDAKVPVAINTGGFDTTQEEMYHFVASGARLRGYAAVIFEGPGQGIVLRRDKLYLRGDWEVVIAAVLDQLFKSAEAHPEWNLDLERIAMIGNSMGALFSLRATAADSRIKACIALDGFYDLGAAGKDRIPWFVKYINPSVIDAIVRFASKLKFQLHWELGHSLFATGSSTLADTLDVSQTITLIPPGREPICEDITVPVLVATARDSIYPIEPHRIYKALTKLEEGKTKTLWDPVDVGHGSLQAKIATLSVLHAHIFEWLDHTFGIQRKAINLENGSA
jgi:pimeloyl-ACP methyl ester carboxylesterase